MTAETFYNMLGQIAIILAVLTLGLSFIHVYTSVKAGK
jgi:hypothetical protein